MAEINTTEKKEVMEATKPLELVGLPLVVDAIYTGYGKYGAYATAYAHVGSKHYKTFLSKSNFKACEQVSKAMGEDVKKKFKMEIIEKTFQNKDGDIIHYAGVKFEEINEGE